jgi:hypothetical protein
VIALDLLLETLPDALVGDGARKVPRVAGDRLPGRPVARRPARPGGLPGRVGLRARSHADPQVDLLLLAHPDGAYDATAEPGAGAA